MIMKPARGNLSRVEGERKGLKDRRRVFGGGAKALECGAPRARADGPDVSELIQRLPETFRGIFPVSPDF